MTDLSDRLERLARSATDGVELLPADLLAGVRRRHRARVRLGIAGAAVLAAAGGLVGVLVPSSQQGTVVRVDNPPPTSAPPVNRLAPRPDLALTPPGWSPVAVGPVQVSVPSAWVIEDEGSVCGSIADQGMVFVDRPPVLRGLGGCGLAPDVVSIAPSSSRAVPHGIRSDLNSITTISGWSPTSPSRTEIVRALGYDITATGPLADQVVHTLTHSARSVVLDSRVTGPPPGWRPVTFGGLQFSVPGTWAVSRSALQGGCEVNLAADTVVLSTPETLTAPSCALPLVAYTAASTVGVPAVVVESGPLIGPAEVGARCPARDGLRICIDPPAPASAGEPAHGLGVLTAQVSVPGRTNPDRVEIGLAGDGATALDIFDSLRAAPT